MSRIKIIIVALAVIAIGVGAAFAVRVSHDRAQSGVASAGVDAGWHIHSAQKLDAEWEEQKGIFRGRMENELKQLDTAIKRLEALTDGGDAGRRDEINEHLADLRRYRGDIKQKRDELAAATGVDWMNIKNDFDMILKDLSD